MSEWSILSHKGTEGLCIAGLKSFQVSGQPVQHILQIEEKEISKATLETLKLGQKSWRLRIHKLETVALQFKGGCPQP